MVCLTTFGDTKRVISHSLIIFHTFYGYVQGGVCSLEGHPTSHLTYSPPFHSSLSPHRIKSFCFFWASLSLNTPCSVIRCPHLSSPVLQVQPPASDSIGYKLEFSQCGSARANVVWCKNHFLQYEKKKQHKTNVSRSPGTINYGTLTSSLCQLL